MACSHRTVHECSGPRKDAMSQEDPLQKGLGELQRLFSNTQLENKPIWCTQISSWQPIFHMEGQSPTPLQERQCHPRDELKWEIRHLGGRAFVSSWESEAAQNWPWKTSILFHLSLIHPLTPFIFLAPGLPLSFHFTLMQCFSSVSSSLLYFPSSHMFFLVQESKIFCSPSLTLLLYYIPSFLCDLFPLAGALPSMPGRQLAVWKVGGGTNKQLSSKNT